MVVTGAVVAGGPDGATAVRSDSCDQANAAPTSTTRLAGAPSRCCAVDGSAGRARRRPRTRGAPASVGWDRVVRRTSLVVSSLVVSPRAPTVVRVRPATDRGRGPPCSSPCPPCSPSRRPSRPRGDRRGTAAPRPRAAGGAVPTAPPQDHGGAPQVVPVRGRGSRRGRSQPVRTPGRTRPVEREVHRDPGHPGRRVVVHPPPSHQCSCERFLRTILRLGAVAEDAVRRPIGDAVQLVELPGEIVVHPFETPEHRERLPHPERFGQKIRQATFRVRRSLKTHPRAADPVVPMRLDTEIARSDRRLTGAAEWFWYVRRGSVVRPRRDLEQMAAELAPRADLAR